MLKNRANSDKRYGTAKLNKLSTQESDLSTASYRLAKFLVKNL